MLIYKEHPSEKSLIKKVNKLVIKYFNLINDKKITKQEKTTLYARTQVSTSLKISIKEVEKLYVKYDSNERSIGKINNSKKITNSMKRNLIVLETQNHEIKKLLASKEMILKDLQANLLEDISKMLEGLSTYFENDDFLLFENNYFNAIHSVQIVFHRMNKKDDLFNYKEEKKKYALERKATLNEAKELKKALV